MHVATRSAVVRGVIANSDIVEGTPVVLTNSGIVNALQSDLPLVTVAASGVNRAVYIFAAAPDDYARPVDIRQYRAGWRVVSDKTSADGYAEPFETITRYNVGLSNLYNPTVPSGVKANAHRGGTYTVPSTVFNDVAGIRVPGALVEVGSSGKWQLATVAANAVGEVTEYRSDTEELSFMLWD